MSFYHETFELFLNIHIGGNFKNSIFVSNNFQHVND